MISWSFFCFSLHRFEPVPSWITTTFYNSQNPKRHSQKNSFTFSPAAQFFIFTHFSSSCVRSTETIITTTFPAGSFVCFFVRSCSDWCVDSDAPWCWSDLDLTWPDVTWRDPGQVRSFFFLLRETELHCTFSFFKLVKDVYFTILMDKYSYII